MWHLGFPIHKRAAQAALQDGREHGVRAHARGAGAGPRAGGSAAAVSWTRASPRAGRAEFGVSWPSAAGPRAGVPSQELPQVSADGPDPEPRRVSQGCVPQPAELP